MAGRLPPPRPQDASAALAKAFGDGGKLDTTYPGGFLHASESHRRTHSGGGAAQRSVCANRQGSTGGHRRAHPAHRRGGAARGADSRSRRSVQRPVLLPVAGRALVRPCRAGPRTHDGVDGAIREEISDGDGRAGVRTRAGGRVLQHRGGVRLRRLVSRQVPEESHPAHGGILGEVLLQAGKPRVSGVQDARRDDRRLHLLRPSLSRKAHGCSA